MIKLSEFREVKLDDIIQHRYLISPDGDLYSTYSNRLLKPVKDKDGYLKTALQKNDGNRKYVRIATLVALTYIGKPPNNMIDPTIDHIDSNILNNHYTNLRWLERSENTAIRNKKGRGEKNPAAILTDNDVKCICALLEDGKLKQTEIARLFGVHKSTIFNIAHGKSWIHISREYEFFKKLLTNE